MVPSVPARPLTSMYCVAAPVLVCEIVAVPSAAPAILVALYHQLGQHQ
jgi:hypothetical protein